MVREETTNSSVWLCLERRKPYRDELRHRGEVKCSGARGLDSLRNGKEADLPRRERLVLNSQTASHAK